MIHTTRILLVCMGNICRSPTAHGVLQHKINQRQLENSITVDSAGTHAYHIGEKADSRSREYAGKQGIDMEFIRARVVTPEDFSQFDYVLAMDYQNLAELENSRPSGADAELALFLKYAYQRGRVDRDDVPDPYYGGGEGFRQVYDLVDAGCDALLDHLAKS